MEKVYKQPKKYYKISKTLSYLLRHNNEGLLMDEYGYVDVNDLIQFLKSNFELDINRYELNELVRVNDKQRFAFSDDGNLIRANQGQTVEVDLQLEEKKPPNILYHGAPDTKIKIILYNGLDKMKRHDVHLSKDIKTAEKVGARRGKFHVLEINAIDMYVDGYKFYMSKNGVWLTKHVPAKYIRF